MMGVSLIEPTGTVLERFFGKNQMRDRFQANSSALWTLRIPKMCLMSKFYYVQILHHTNLATLAFYY